jgi:peptidoglycan hydrolase-like amidase
LELSKDEDFACWLSDDGSWKGRGVFCSPEVVSDEELGRFLGAVDSVTKYFRWEHTISAEQVIHNLKEKCDVQDVAALREVNWGPRGVSGRYLSATLVYESTNGGVTQLPLPNQFVIRGVFHESFLYSSAFVCQVTLEGSDIRSLRFSGAGWGHGVGLCQIGALGMARGQSGVFEPQPYEAILGHYFLGSSLRGGS